MRLSGQARDYKTGNDSDGVILETAQTNILASPTREILEIAVEPHCLSTQKLIGVRGGGQSRKIVADAMGEELEIGSPLYLLLDDYAGASLVAAWAWSKWENNWVDFMRIHGASNPAGRKGVMTGICIGFAPGSKALDSHGGARLDAQNNGCQVPSIIHPDDPEGWHKLDEQEGVGMRRARCIDLWRENGFLNANIRFQDSCTTPRGERFAIHEYTVALSADAETFVLHTIAPQAHILPYSQCPGAIDGVQNLIGKSLKDMRKTVLDMFPGALGCTHLNDVLRSTADIPRLAKVLADA